MSAEIRKVKPDELAAYLRVLPYANGLPWGVSDNGRPILERGGLVGVEPDPDRGDLAAAGLAGDHDRPLGRIEHERRARVDLKKACGEPPVRARADLEPEKLPAAFQ
jgi:hypothetical protein